MLSKVLIKLLEAPVKPEHPMDFIRDNLGATMFEKNQIEQLEQTVRDYKHEVDDLKSQIDDLKRKLDGKTVIEAKMSNEAADAVIPAKETVAVEVAAPVVAVTAGPTVAGEEPSSDQASSIANLSVADDSDKKTVVSEEAVAPIPSDVDEVKTIESAAGATASLSRVEDVVTATVTAATTAASADDGKATGEKKDNGDAAATAAAEKMAATATIDDTTTEPTIKA